MRSTPQELAFALRSPNSGPLAAVVCALADLFEDPSFNEGHRALLGQLLAGGEIPQFLAERATERLTSFANSLEDLHRQVLPATAATPSTNSPASKYPACVASSDHRGGGHPQGRRRSRPFPVLREPSELSGDACMRIRADQRLRV